MSDLRTVVAPTMAGPVRATYAPDVPPLEAMRRTNEAGEAIAAGDEGRARELLAGFLRGVLVGWDRKDAAGGHYPIKYEALLPLDVRWTLPVAWAISSDMVARRPPPLTIEEIRAKVDAEMAREQEGART